MFAYLRPYSHTSSSITNEEGEEISVYDTIPSNDLGVDEQYEISSITKRYATLVHDALSTLDDRCKIIIQKRHLINDGVPPATLKSLGLELGVSGEAVRKMELRAISAMKRHIIKSSGGTTSLFK
jgi:DNA-directed RNA polymerase sigma subunit (sigma70/sigma32)